MNCFFENIGLLEPLVTNCFHDLRFFFHLTEYRRNHLQFLAITEVQFIGAQIDLDASSPFFELVHVLVCFIKLPAASYRDKELKQDCCDAVRWRRRLRVAIAANAKRYGRDHLADP